MRSVPAAVEVVLPENAVIAGPIRRPRSPGAAAIESGSRVVLAGTWTGSRLRLRRRAARLGLVVESEYLVLPTWGHASFVVDAHPDVLAWFVHNLATVPPGLSRGSRLVDLALTVCARPVLVRWLGLLAPGSLLVGVRR
ncbi:MAG TPA: hypothetical protein VIR15_15055 [Intrasporangium sp.]|uniref:hypothetical protein n=1 Tax=Intrasporangium sp. TaxID=1925024 RepID=UPI002F93458D